MSVNCDWNTGCSPDDTGLGWCQKHFFKFVNEENVTFHNTDGTHLGEWSSMELNV